MQEHRSSSLPWGIRDAGRTIRRTALATALLLGLAAAPAPAATFFGDITGNNIASGYGMGPGGGVDNGIAEGFTMTQTISLGSVDTYFSLFTAASGSTFKLSIFSDASNLPGTDLFDLTTNLGNLANSSTPQLATWTGTGSFTLNSGTKYWLELYASNPASSTGDFLQWDGEFTPASAFANPTGTGVTDVGQLRSISSGGAFTGSPSTTELRTAFELNSAPEPTSTTLLALASLGLATRRRRSAR